MKKTISLILALLLWASAAFAIEDTHTRQDVRSAYENAFSGYDGSPYAQSPQVNPPHAAGALDERAVEDAAGYLNFMRWLAYLDEPVSTSRIYNYQCQHGAVLMAALDYVSHNAPSAPGMDSNFYDSAHLAASSSNIAKFNWMRPSILREGIEYFLRDDGEENLPLLGHRRWALNPLMKSTGFGLANSESGMSYVLMYAHDFGNPEAAWSEVCWPSQGAFPADFMYTNLAWSITLNPAVYNMNLSSPIITLTEESEGLSFRFNTASGAGSGFCTINFDGYGAGPCIIFRPDFSSTDFSDYRQNQKWHVSVEGLYLSDGAETALEYDVEMISLRYQDVANVEISHLEASMYPGEALYLSANIVPDYADDLSIQWISSDESIAIVDENGIVSAIAPGKCEIIARSANGREDFCALTVE